MLLNTPPPPRANYQLQQNFPSTIFWFAGFLGALNTLLLHNWNTATHSVDHRPASSALPESLSEMHNLQNQYVHFSKGPCDSDALGSLRSSVRASPSLNLQSSFCSGIMKSFHPALRSCRSYKKQLPSSSNLPSNMPSTGSPGGVPIQAAAAQRAPTPQQPCAGPTTSPSSLKQKSLLSWPHSQVQTTWPFVHTHCFKVPACSLYRWSGYWLMAFLFGLFSDHRDGHLTWELLAP